MTNRAGLTTSYWPADDSEDVWEVTMGDLLRRVAAEVPDRIALVDGQPDPAARRRWTYAELLTGSVAVAEALVARFEPGERVAVWAPNRPEWVFLQLGAALAGVVLVTVNPAYQATELAYVLRQSGAAGIVHEDAYRGVSLAAVAAEVRPDLADLREVVSFSDWEAFAASGTAGAALPPVASTDPVQIQYTSGTTGFARGALLHHRGAVGAARLSAERAGLQEGDCWVNPIPLFHVGGCVLAGVGSIVGKGVHVVVPAFDAGLVLELIEAEQGRLVLAVPTMLIALLDHPDRPERDLSSIRTVMSGSSTVPAELVRRTRAAVDCDFSVLFGQTELHGVLTQTHPTDSAEDQAETIGQPLARVEVKVADPTGAPVPIGEPGEICARGYQAMAGYFEMPEATAATIDTEGWLHTGDLGSMDERGYLVGVPDERWGEQVGAVVRAAEGARPPTVAELHEHCRAHLAPFKTPRVWFFVDVFPMTPSGKIRKFVLKDLMAAGDLQPRE